MHQYETEIKVLKKCIELCSTPGKIRDIGPYTIDPAVHRSQMGYIVKSQFNRIMYYAGSVFYKSQLQMLSINIDKHILFDNSVLTIYVNNQSTVIGLDEFNNCSDDERFNNSVLYSQDVFKYVEIFTALKDFIGEGSVLVIQNDFENEFEELNKVLL